MKSHIATSSRAAWRILRPLALAYLVIAIAMMLLEPWLVYPIPSAHLGDWNPTSLNHQDVWFQSEDGTKLNGWFVPRANAKRAILYCHGNGEHIAFNADLVAHLSHVLDSAVFIFDYRGYGRSEGWPSETGCIADGRAAQLWLAHRVGIKPTDVVIMGRSLGGGVAVALAAELGAKALILESTFPSMPDVAAEKYPLLPVRWAMDNRYDSLAQIRQYQGPLFQSHGTADEIVSLPLARRLFEASPSDNKQWLEFADCNHNSPCPPTYYAKLAAFLNKADETDSVPPTAGR